MTSTVIKFRPLYVEESTRSNFCGVVMFGQDQQFLGIEGDDRRFFLVDSSPIKVGNTDYFQNLFQQYEDDRVARAYYQYLLKIDLSQFHTSTSRPETLARRDMVSFSAKPFYIFLQRYIKAKDFGINVSTKPVVPKLSFWVTPGELFSEYQLAMEELFPKHQDLMEKRKFNSNVRCMIQDSAKDVDGVVVQAMYRSKNGGRMNFRIKECLEFLSRYVHEEDVNEKTPTMFEEEEDDGVSVEEEEQS